MSLKELMQNQGEIPLTLNEGEQRTKTTLNGLDSLSDYRVMINFKGSKEAILLGRMCKDDIYKELAEVYMIDKEILESSNIEIHVQELNLDYNLI